MVLTFQAGPLHSHLVGICYCRSLAANVQLCVLQVYLILDEFILGGEFEETSKKVRGCGVMILCTACRVSSALSRLQDSKGRPRMAKA